MYVLTVQLLLFLSLSSSFFPPISPPLSPPCFLFLSLFPLHVSSLPLFTSSSFSFSLFLLHFLLLLLLFSPLHPSPPHFLPPLPLYLFLLSPLLPLFSSMCLLTTTHAGQPSLTQDCPTLGMSSRYLRHSRALW